MREELLRSDASREGMKRCDFTPPPVRKRCLGGGSSNLVLPLVEVEYRRQGGPENAPGYRLDAGERCQQEQRLHSSNIDVPSDSTIILEVWKTPLPLENAPPLT